MRVRDVRLGIVAVIAVALFLYYFPVVPYSFSAPCSSSSAFGCGPFTRESGLDSITTSLLGYGAAYSYQWGYTFGPGLLVGTFQYGVGATAGYTISVYFTGLPVVLLAACLIVGLLSPEIVDGSHLLSLIIGDRLGRSVAPEVVPAEENDS